MSNPLHVIVPNNQAGESGRTVLWVSELPEKVSDSDLDNFFIDYKDSILVIQINRISRVMESIAPRGVTATVIFKNHLQADKARTSLNMRKLRGKTIRIMLILISLIHVVLCCAANVMILKRVEDFAV